MRTIEVFDVLGDTLKYILYTCQSINLFSFINIKEYPAIKDYISLSVCLSTIGNKDDICELAATIPLSDLDNPS